MTPRPRMLFRIAAVISALYAAGHTFGFQTFRPPSAQGQAVFHAMNTVSFQVDGARFSYGEFYLGFGLFVGAALLLVAVLTWWLGNLSIRSPDQTVVPGAAITAFHLVGMGLCLRFFSAAPAAFSAVIILLMVVAILSARKIRQAAVSHK